MAFAAHCGLELALPAETADPAAFLFCEEPGAVIQVASADCAEVIAAFDSSGLGDNVIALGEPVPGERLYLESGGDAVLDESLSELQGLWCETSHAVQRLRDNPACADQELETASDWRKPGMRPSLAYDPEENPAAPMIATGARPAVAILREQGVNGQVEMAAAFERAVQTGRAPALAYLAEHGDYRQATSVFPSLTPVCLAQ